MLQENFVAEWNRQISAKTHQQNLEKIKKRELKGLNNTFQPIQYTKKAEIEKSLKINRENKILYNKLTIISERNNLITLNRSLSPSQTLNSRYKKLEAERITLENINLVTRLSYNNSDLSVKKLMKDYKLNEEYRNRISKKNFHDRIKKAVNYTIKSKSEHLSKNSDKLKSST